MPQWASDLVGAVVRVVRYLAQAVGDPRLGPCQRTQPGRQFAQIVDFVGHIGHSIPYTQSDDPLL
jgi:hypothetical protein